MSVKKHRGIDTLKSRYGIMFISPWILGMVIFFLVPIFQSIYYTSADISIDADGAHTTFVGNANFYQILVKDPKYLDNLLAALSNMLVSLPFILIVSMVLALLLNGKYFGRTFFRGLYFVQKHHQLNLVADEIYTLNMIDFSQMLSAFNLPEQIETFFMTALSNIFLLVWQSGIQTVLLIAGLQSIPDTLYEVAKVEGTTKWEEFWYITFPMLMRTMFLVIIFTVIELASANSNEVIKSGYDQFNLMEYGLGTSMLWFYFVFVGIFVLLLFAVYRKFFLKKWG